MFKIKWIVKTISWIFGIDLIALGGLISWIFEIGLNALDIFVDFEIKLSASDNFVGI